MDEAKQERQDHAVKAWLQQRREQWALLTKLVSAPPADRDEDPSYARKLLSGFRLLARDLAMARQVLNGGRLTHQLEALFSQAHELIYQRAGNPWQELLAIYRKDIPDLFLRKMRAPILITTGLFIGTAVAGWLLVYPNPELASLMASEEMINKVQRGELWTDDLLNVVPSSVLSLGIMTNNIAVSFFAFGLGALYGIGTIYIIGLNGLMLGGIFAFTAQYGMAERLFNFVIAHGVVELSVICLAGAAGAQLGEALIRPGDRTRTEAFQKAVSEAGKLLFVIVPFLVGAGLIEGYISPNDDYSLGFRVVVGVSYGVLLWAVLSGRIWSVLPSMRSRPPSRSQ